MGGRKDYEERKQRRIDRYNELSKKAKEKSIEYSNSNANRILQIAPGQPILIGHHSEKRHRRLIEKANNDIKRSIEMDDKSNYYAQRAKSAENSKAIYNDDPNAIQKLEEKLEKLENERKIIKAREHSGWELTNIGANIRETKKRIERLKELEKLEFIDIEFKGGKAIHNKEINRIQLLFDDIPSENIRRELKHNGFHWSRNEGAWQREFNKTTIGVTKRVIKDVIEKETEKNNMNLEEEEDEIE